MINSIKLENCSVQDLNKAANAYHKKHWDNGGASESDPIINEISRAKILALYKEHGSCFMYKLNKWKVTDPDVWEFSGSKIFNFHCSFITAKKDDFLSQMVIDYNKPKTSFNAKRAWKQVEDIFSRVEKVGGIITSWV